MTKAEDTLPETEDPEKRERRLAYLREWRKTHKANRSKESKEKSKARMREQYATDPEYRERIKTAVKEYRKANPEKVREANRKWLDKNRPQQREYHRNYNRERWNNDPDFHKRSLEAKTIWRMRNWAKLADGEGWIHNIKDQQIDVTILRRLHAWQSGRCYICNRISENLTVEHLIPRSRNGPTIPGNIVLSCPECNYSRQNKILHTEWMPEVIEAQTFDLAITTSRISKILTEYGLNPKLSGEFFTISGPLATKHLHIISTFSGSERNPGSKSGRFATWITQDDPDAIALFDYEWFSRQSAALNMLRAKVGISERTFSARQLTIIEPRPDTGREFLNTHHLMGDFSSTYRIGLNVDDILYGLGVFIDKGKYYECARLAFRGHVPGGMSKIIKYLWRTYDQKPILSFVDSRYASGLGHETIGFERIGLSPETYLWVFPDRVQHQRYLSSDNKLSKALLYFNPKLHREANIAANGLHRIWLPPKLKILLKP
jgi:hypothetical protein